MRDLLSHQITQDISAVHEGIKDMLRHASENARRAGPVAVVKTIGEGMRNSEEGWRYGGAPIAFKLAISTWLTVEDLA